MKSYVKLASGLLLSGLGAIALERALAAGMSSSGMYLPAGIGWVTAILAIAPLVLVAAGVLVYLGGAILGLK